MATPTYVNTRIRKSPAGSKWIVEGQNASTYNWDEMLNYDEKHGQAQEKAVTAYNRQGNAVAVYLKGEPYKKN